MKEMVEGKLHDRQDMKVRPDDKDGDAHYDTVSALIKSVRGSDPDAALFWLAKMLYGVGSAVAH